MIDFAMLTREELEALSEAAREAMTCQRVLAKTGDSVVGELLRGAGTFYEWRHYPPGDVYDVEYHAQYYYHAHSETERPVGEHGHFHTFLRPQGMPDGLLPVDGQPPRGGDNEALSHLVGVAMSRAGLPVRLFTTNRWVTGETWYAADSVMRMLDHFVIDHARPSWPVNRWITAIVRLFRPQITELLRRRDIVVARHAENGRLETVFEDRTLEVLSEVPVSIEEQIARVDLALRGRHRVSADPGAPGLSG